MAKNINRFGALCLLFLHLSLCASFGSVEKPECIVQTAESFIHVREATGRNDGPEVELFLKSVGLGKGFSWCSAFVHYVLSCCGVNNSVNAWSPTAHNSKDVVFMNGKLFKPAEPGDVFTVWSHSKGRIGHTGFFLAARNDRFFQSIEGNTNEGGSMNGDGVYKRIRSYKQTHSITRWRN